MKAASLLPHPAEAIQQPGFKALLNLAVDQHVFIKISGFYRASDDHVSAYADLESVVRKFAEQVPDQLLWASDWPHTGNPKDRKGRGIDATEPFKKIDDVAILGNIQKWVGEVVWQKIMVENPSKMFR
jgi:predicted TIM-barrel fold metal-dependent hydrolase